MNIYAYLVGTFICQLKYGIVSKQRHTLTINIYP